MANFFYPHSRSQTRKFTTAPEESLSGSQVLYDEVIRKNHEMIKTLLIKISEVYSRQEEYEQGISNINLRILDIAKNNKDLHHEMRANQVEADQKYQILINEVKGVKNVLKIPDPTKSYEEYLSSGFFKQQSSLVTERNRSRRRNKTNYQQNKDQTEPIQPKKHLTAQQRPYIKPQPKTSIAILQVPQRNNPPQVNFKDLDGVMGEESKKARESLSQSQSLNKSRIKDSIEQFQSQINALKEQIRVNEEQSEQKMTALKEKLKQEVEEERQKLLKEMEQKNNWNRLDFLELQKYLDNKVKEQFGERINKTYFQESLNNLKESWQEQLQEVYSLVNLKLIKDDLTPLEDKINDILQQLQNLTNLNSLKIQNISYSSTCKSTPFRVNLQRTSVADQESNHRITRQSEEPTNKKSNLKYCNSLSILRGRPESHKKSPRIQDSHSRMVQEMSEKKWKERAEQTLGLPCKKIRRRGRP